MFRSVDLREDYTLLAYVLEKCYVMCKMDWSEFYLLKILWVVYFGYVLFLNTFSVLSAEDCHTLRNWDYIHILTNNELYINYMLRIVVPSELSRPCGSEERKSVARFLMQGVEFSRENLQTACAYVSNIPVDPKPAFTSGIYTLSWTAIAGNDK